MCLVFVEYRIALEYRAAYLSWKHRLSSLHPEVEIYEGKNQPGLFVELWRGITEDRYERMKQIRTGCGVEDQTEAGAELDEFGWEELNEWISGGSAKIHIWLFEKVK